MKKLVFVFLLFVNLLQAQKIEVGFMFSPQITTSNFESLNQINPLHVGLWYHFNPNTFMVLAYTTENKNIFSGLLYKNYYMIQSVSTNSTQNYAGLGTLFEIPKIEPVIFLEIGTNYSFKEKNTFPVILSTGIFISFKKEIYNKQKGST